MATNEIRMGEGALGRAAQLVADARADFDRLAADLDGRIAGLRGRWTGAGGEAFFVLHQTWSEKQRTVVGALDGFEAALLTTQRDVAATDDAQAAAFHTYQSRLG